MKATLCGRVAKAGFCKETRSVLSHHSFALLGSEVVYSRDLQLRAIQKLQMLLKRTGLDDPERPSGATSETAGKPVAADGASFATSSECIIAGGSADGSVAAVEEVSDCPVEGELQDEAEAQTEVTAASSTSSTDSDSDSSNSSSSSDSGPDQNMAKAYCEEVPGGFVYLRHVKSGVTHKAIEGAVVMQCKCRVSPNFRNLPRRLRVRYPKCLPGNKTRTRTTEEMVQALDNARAQVRKLNE